MRKALNALIRLTSDEMFPPGTGGWIFSRTKSYVSYHVRPINTDLIEVSPRRIPSEERETGILIQGPIQDEGRFTLETIKLYRRLFPLSPVVVSTWSKVDVRVLSALENHGAIVKTSIRPAQGGWGNLRLQQISTSTGLSALIDLGCRFVAKTRTDWRMHRATALTRLFELINDFPVEAASLQKHRIVASNIFTFKHRVYGLTDIFQFGHIDDMLNYWEAELRVPRDQRSIFDIDKPVIVEGTPIVAEIYQCAHYLATSGVALQFTLDQWWDALRDRFLIVDNTMLDAFWHRHDHRREFRHQMSYRLRGPLLVDHLDWLSLQKHRNSGWSDSPFRERWTEGVVKGFPNAGGISQLSV